ncbi:MULTISPECIES: LysR family transcriptional regulator [Rhodopseudomonas]|uniref:LysR family transcriptional regulator n=1 Tax=Rhodopseudomonas palustris TaxID=1076 RepID=A0A0D7EVY5_RHOPL|nr:MULTISPECIES: LysR family transcriptional regulator [Rhodopseudomonas]KIZ44953.1 LysR family transcriptional regulator [Rhodopseudomonas palustris]MDF3812240.1 LysR family transcriptional regulator [Rhodopseudomonas sp. BAL398]WOK15414.1 LysR family transcriptional regulator [Rhodopseudomonas sp. BAL398]
MDRLTSLTAFVQVVDSNGFSAAARKLGMSTTMVSNHVQALEASLGVRLLNRTTRKVSPTEIGRAYYDSAAQVLADLEQADAVVRAQQSTPRGTLRVQAATHMVPFIAPVVAQFLLAYPEVKVDLRLGESAVDLIDNGIDVALRMTLPPDSSFIVRKLATWRHVLCCAPSYLRDHDMPRQLADLAGHDCLRHVIYPYGDEWRFVDRDGAPASVRVSGRLLTDSGETLHIAALAGAGICLAAGFLVQASIESGRLVRLLPEYRPVEMTMNAVYPHRRHPSAKLKTFVDMLVKHSTAQQRLIDHDA